MEYWMIGVLGNIFPDILHTRSRGGSVCAAFRTFKTLLSIPDHYSITPTTPGSEGTLLAPFHGAPNNQLRPS